MAFKRDYMERALELAKYAASLGETPVGAVIVKNDQIIAEAYNRREIDKDPLAHAEILAIREASRALGGWRLIGCELYVTLEPCMMCTGAIIQSRIESVYIGTDDQKAGCVTSKLRLLDEMWINHKPHYESGFMSQESSRILKDFFKALRNSK